MDSRQWFLSIGFLIGASVAGGSIGLARKQLADQRALTQTTAQLQFLSPLLQRGAVYSGTFVGDFSPQAWNALSRDDKTKAATDLSVRLLDTNHVPSAVVFVEEKPAVIISQASPRLIDE